MTEAEARRLRQTAQPPDPNLSGGLGTLGSDEQVQSVWSGGLSLSGRDMKYMAVGAGLLLLALIIGIKTLLPTQQIIKAIAT